MRPEFAFLKSRILIEEYWHPQVEETVLEFEIHQGKNKTHKNSPTHHFVKTMSTCPLTQELVNPSVSCFTFARSGNPKHSVCFDAKRLIEYMLSSGDFSDPESRIPFSCQDLIRLDTIGVELGQPSVLLQSKNQEKKKEALLFQNGLFGLERVCGQIVSDMFNMVEQVEESELDFGDMCCEIDSNLVPDLVDCFSQLFQADFEFGNQSAKTFERFLKGPPNKPKQESEAQSYIMESYCNAINEAKMVAESARGVENQ